MTSEEIQWKKTDKYNNMIEAFECDFKMIQEDRCTFADLDKVLKEPCYSLMKDMDLLQELAFLIRHGKAEIYVKE